MSKETQKPEPSEEIDLGQLFKLIGDAFDRLFNFIGSLFNKLFLAFVWGVFFIKRHFVILVAAALIGFVYGFVKEKYSKPVYSTNAVIKQNYNTGESIYTSLNYYNDLIADSDTISLSQSLNITPNEASQLVSFSMESVLNENSKLKVFDRFKKEVDSSISEEVDFDRFLENSSDYDYEYQRLTLKSTNKSLPRKILPNVISNITSIEFFKNEQMKDLTELDSRELMLREALKESDSLQKIYQAVLQKEEVSSDSQTSFTINNAQETSTTKEFELFRNDIDLRRELVAIKREKEDKQKIVEIISSRQDEGIIDNSIAVFDVNVDYKYFYALAAFLLASFILAFLTFLKFLEKYKDKV